MAYAAVLDMTSKLIFSTPWKNQIGNKTLPNTDRKQISNSVFEFANSLDKQKPKIKIHMEARANSTFAIMVEKNILDRATLSSLFTAICRVALRLNP